jgi:hypothetical protein
LIAADEKEIQLILAAGDRVQGSASADADPVDLAPAAPAVGKGWFPREGADFAIDIGHKEIEFVVLRETAATCA